MPARYTYSQEKRIRKNSDYKRLFFKGQKVGSHHLKLYYTVEEGPRQMGAVISRKIKGSVIRNRHKRLIREYFRLNQYKLVDHIKLVIFVTTCFQPATYKALEQELTGLLKKARMIISTAKPGRPE